MMMQQSNSPTETKRTIELRSDSPINDLTAETTQLAEYECYETVLTDLYRWNIR